GRGDRGEHRSARGCRGRGAGGDRRLRRGLERLRLGIPKPQGKLGGLVELAVIVALALGLALAIQAWIIKPYQIPSESMEPTLDVGQRVLVNRFIYDLDDPTVGDIVVFHPPVGADDGTECGVPHGPDEACPKPTPE